MTRLIMLLVPFQLNARHNASCYPEQLIKSLSTFRFCTDSRQLLSTWLPRYYATFRDLFVL